MPDTVCGVVVDFSITELTSFHTRPLRSARNLFLSLLRGMHSCTTSVT